MGEKSKARSRFHPQPLGKELLISPRTLQLFQLLNRYKYLPSDYLHAFVGGHKGRLLNRLTDLRHEGYLYCNPSQYKTANARYRPLVYELGDRARTILRDHGIPIRNFDFLTGPFAHDLMSCQAVASIEIGCIDDPTLRFIHADEILASPKAAAAKDLAHPFKYQVSVSWNGQKDDMHHFSPDWEPFGIEITKGGKKQYVFIAGYETDAHTETLRPSELSHSSILKKILAYQKLDQEDRFHKRLGIPNTFFLFLTVNEQHRQNMIELVRELCGPSELFLFKTIPHFASFEKSPPPTPELLTEPWQRAHKRAFNLSTGEEV